MRRSSKALHGKFKLTLGYTLCVSVKVFSTSFVIRLELHLFTLSLGVSFTSLMEGEHTPIIFYVILAIDHASIQLKVHMKFFGFQQSLTMNENSKKYTHYETDFIMKGTLRKKMHQDR